MRAAFVDTAGLGTPAALLTPQLGKRTKAAVDWAAEKTWLGSWLSAKAAKHSVSSPLVAVLWCSYEEGDQWRCCPWMAMPGGGA